MGAWRGSGTVPMRRCGSFEVDPNSGVLTETGFLFDVGLQGTIGDLATLGDHLLITDDWDVTDDVDGLYAFRYQANGFFEPIGPAVPSQGVWPTAIAAWNPPATCPADINGNGMVDLPDLAALLAGFGSCDGDPLYDADADLAPNGCLDLADLALLLAAFGTSCPS